VILSLSRTGLATIAGEATFMGQANGAWLWQNGVGAMITDAHQSASFAEEYFPEPPALVRLEQTNATPLGASEV
jgi:hypothetical protein